MLPEIVNNLTDSLFTNGCGQKAKRLVLELDDKRDGGGWCRTAVSNQIAAALEPLAVRLTELEEMLRQAGFRECDRCYRMVPTERSGSLRYCKECWPLRGKK